MKSIQIYRCSQCRKRFFDRCTCEHCGSYKGFLCSKCCFEAEKSFANDSDPNSNEFDHPSQISVDCQPFMDMHTQFREEFNTRAKILKKTIDTIMKGNNSDDHPQVPLIYDPDICYNQNIGYSPQPQYQPYLCELCGNEAHYGFDCQPQVPSDYNQDPSYNQNFNYFSHDSQNLPQ